VESVLQAILEYVVTEVVSWLYAVLHHIGSTEYLDVGLCKHLVYVSCLQTGYTRPL